MYFKSPSFAGSARGTSLGEGTGSWRPPTLLIGTIEIDSPEEPLPAETLADRETFGGSLAPTGESPVIIADLDQLKLDLQSLISNFKTIIGGI